LAFDLPSADAHSRPWNIPRPLLPWRGQSVPVFCSAYTSAYSPTKRKLLRRGLFDKVEWATDDQKK